MTRGPSKEERLRRIAEAAAPVAAAFGLELWGVELAGSGRPVVRIFVDAPARNAAGAPAAENGPPPGVTVDQCAEISRMVGLALDVEDLFADAWTLEVSSPGLERPFFRPGQLRAYVGRQAEVLLWDPHPDFPGRRKFCGQVATVEGDTFTLRLSAADDPAGGTPVRIPWDEVRRARLVHLFPDTSKPRPGQAAAPKSARTAAPAEGGGTHA
ncbi:MAG: ribosome maturation factor RimP [Desulfovibrionaceae bacterium]|nr:ribosome maturation factor RimP [Desulfovibrionaceae bacterium]